MLFTQMLSIKHPALYLASSCATTFRALLLYSIWEVFGMYREFSGNEYINISIVILINAN